MYSSSLELQVKKNSKKENFPSTEFKNISFIQNIVMAYSGITISIPIEESMAHPEKYNTVLHITIIFLTILYCGFGVLAYAFFGNAVNSVITDNLRDDWEAYLPKGL